MRQSDQKIKIECAFCGASYLIPRARAQGRRIRAKCKRCGRPIETTCDSISDGKKVINPLSEDQTTPVYPGNESAEDQTEGWYIALDGDPMGPITTDHVKSFLEIGRISGDTYACYSGEAQWRQLKEIPKFKFEAYEKAATGYYQPVSSDRNSDQSPPMDQTILEPPDQQPFLLEDRATELFHRSDVLTPPGPKPEKNKKANEGEEESAPHALTTQEVFAMAVSIESTARNESLSEFEPPKVNAKELPRKKAKPYFSVPNVRSSDSKYRTLIRSTLALITVALLFCGVLAIFLRSKPSKIVVSSTTGIDSNRNASKHTGSIDKRAFGVDAGTRQDAPKTAEESDVAVNTVDVTRAVAVEIKNRVVRNRDRSSDRSRRNKPTERATVDPDDILAAGGGQNKEAVADEILSDAVSNTKKRETQESDGDDSDSNSLVEVGNDDMAGSTRPSEKEVRQRVIDDVSGPVSECMNAAGSEEKLTIEVLVFPSGRVTFQVLDPQPERALATCVAKTAHRLKFSSFFGSTVHVRITFSL